MQSAHATTCVVVRPSGSKDQQRETNLSTPFAREHIIILGLCVQIFVYNGSHVDRLGAQTTPGLAMIRLSVELSHQGLLMLRIGRIR
jgi:hypothetical protein